MPELRAIARVVLIALACGAALAATNWLTSDRIHFNEAAALRAAVAELLPENVDAPPIPPELDQVPGAWKLCSGHLLGRSDVRGYAGDIRLLYTLESDEPSSRLVRLAVLGHQETPGIADFLSSPAWLSNFHYRDAGDVEAMAAITGATITSVAVRDHLASALRDPAGELGQAIALECGQ
jgi:Na+-translocating ferredoxin:NAD+ oxidoreductase RnfG subunit